MTASGVSPSMDGQPVHEYTSAACLSRISTYSGVAYSHRLLAIGQYVGRSCVIGSLMKRERHWRAIVPYVLVKRYSCYLWHQTSNRFLLIL